MIPDLNWPLIGSFVVGAVGVALGLWSRIDRIRDRRKAAHASLPKAEIESYGQSEKPGWYNCRLLFSSSHHARFTVLSIEGEGWTFALGKPSDPTRPAYDPSPEIVDIDKAAAILKIDSPVEIPPKAGGMIYSDISFWASSSRLSLNRQPSAIYLNCQWRWESRSSFRLKVNIW